MPVQPGPALPSAAPSPVIAAPPAPVRSHAIQRAELPDYGELLGLDAYRKKPGVVVSLPADTTPEQSRFYTASSKRYSGLKVQVLNKKKLVAGEKIGKRTFQKAKGAEDAILVATGHGNMQWMFGDSPGNEEAALPKFIQWIHSVEGNIGLPLMTIVLDSCYSAVELKTPVEGVPNDSTARILSRLLGGNYTVVGFNGTASDSYISHMSQGGNVKSDYGSNAVIFRNGEVIKGSVHPDSGDGILHKSTYINTEDHEFYGRAFPEGAPKRYRSNSFSNASPENPQ